MRPRSFVSNDELSLETSKHRQVKNCTRSAVITTGDLATAKAVARGLQEKYTTVVWKTLVDISHNCHGLTFGSKRTCIDRPSEIQKILDDDNYSEIDIQNSLGGDVIVYYMFDRAEHTGLVLGRGSSPFNPIVLSKWGLGGPEVIHNAHDSEYGVEIKIFRKAPLC